MAGPICSHVKQILYRVQVGFVLPKMSRLEVLSRSGSGEMERLIERPSWRADGCIVAGRGNRMIRHGLHLFRAKPAMTDESDELEDAESLQR